MTDPVLDEVLMGMAHRLGGIEPMLNAFFGFLHRKTDFYVLLDRGKTMGFPPGVAEKMVSCSIVIVTHRQWMPLNNTR